VASGTLDGAGTKHLRRGGSRVSRLLRKKPVDLFEVREVTTQATPERFTLVHLHGLVGFDCAQIFSDDVRDPLHRHEGSGSPSMLAHGALQVHPVHGSIDREEVVEQHVEEVLKREREERSSAYASSEERPFAPFCQQEWWPDVHFHNTPASELLMENLWLLWKYFVHEVLATFGLSVRETTRGDERATAAKRVHRTSMSPPFPPPQTLTFACRRSVH